MRSSARLVRIVEVFLGREDGFDHSNLNLEPRSEYAAATILVTKVGCEVDTSVTQHHGPRGVKEIASQRV